jgi:hypothetical protein
MGMIFGTDPELFFKPLSIQQVSIYFAAGATAAAPLLDKPQM